MEKNQNGKTDVLDGGRFSHKQNRRSYALVSVEPIKMSRGYAFLAYLDYTLAGAKDEAQIHADNQDEKSDH